MTSTIDIIFTKSTKRRKIVYSLSVKEYTALKPREWRDDVMPLNSKESRGPLLMIGRDGFSPQNESIFSFFLSMCTYATNESTPSHLKLYKRNGGNTLASATFFRRVVSFRPRNYETRHFDNTTDVDPLRVTNIIRAMKTLITIVSISIIR